MSPCYKIIIQLNDANSSVSILHDVNTASNSLCKRSSVVYRHYDLTWIVLNNIQKF